MASGTRNQVHAADDRTAAMKTRIITHMNADHAESLTLYLRNFCGVPETTAKSARLTDVTLEHMIIESDIGRNLIGFDPPMKSLAESRERMVALHQESLQALGISDIKISSYAPPHRAWQWGLFFLVLWCYGTFPFPERVRPGSSSFMYYGWSLGDRVPVLAQLAADLSPAVLPGMLVIHAAESIYMWSSRLRKHGLSLTELSTWLWITNTFVSGFGCIRRFDELVDEKIRAKDGKH